MTQKKNTRSGGEVARALGYLCLAVLLANVVEALDLSSLLVGVFVAAWALSTVVLLVVLR